MSSAGQVIFINDSYFSNISLCLPLVLCTSTTTLYLTVKWLLIKANGSLAELVIIHMTSSVLQTINLFMYKVTNT
jgi:hypothetical protein